MLKRRSRSTPRGAGTSRPRSVAGTACRASAEIRPQLAAAAADLANQLTLAVRNIPHWPPTRTQESIWWSGPRRVGGVHSQWRSRQVPDAQAIWRLAQQMLQESVIDVRRIHAAVEAAGCPKERVLSQRIAPLVRSWLLRLATTAPAAPDAGPLVTEFADVVTKGIRKSRSRFQADGIRPASSPLDLGFGVQLRPIDESELWEFGDVQFMGTIDLDPMAIPSPDWVILDCHDVEQCDEPWPISYVSAQATAASLALTGLRRFHLRPLLHETEWHFLLGRKGVDMLQFGRPCYPGPEVELSPTQERDMRLLWPVARRVLANQGADGRLRMGLRRLVDAVGRQQQEDALVDFAIGLETLLSPNEMGEQSFQFALRGATILGSLGYNQGTEYGRLRRFYRTRSKLVHGRPPAAAAMAEAMAEAMAIGFDALRNIWRWLIQSPKGVNAALKDIDDRIENGVNSPRPDGSSLAGGAWGCRT